MENAIKILNLENC